MNKEKYLTEIKEYFNDEVLNQLIDQLEPPILKYGRDVKFITYSRKNFIVKFWVEMENRINNLDDNKKIDYNIVLSAIIKTFNVYLKEALKILKN